MGIRDLQKFLDTWCTYETKPLYWLAQKTIAIDMSTLMYKYLYVAKKHIYEHEGIENTETRVLEYWIQQFRNLIRYLHVHRIQMVAVFDGEAPEAKQHTRDKRKAKYQQIQDKIGRLQQQWQQGEPVYASLIHVMALDNQIQESYTQHLWCALQHEPVMLKQAEGEAERDCAQMCHKGLVDAVYSTDTDLYAYLCPLVIRSIHNDQFTAITMKRVLKQLQMTPEAFQHMCVMAGTDYHDRVHGIKTSYDKAQAGETADTSMFRLPQAASSQGYTASSCNCA